MTADALLVLKALFGPIWALFTSWTIPGTGVSPGEWAIFVLFAILGLKFLKRIGLFIPSGSDDK